MARARNIKPSLFKNELLGQADPLLTLLFVSLWCLADRAGRLEDRPLRIKAETFPYREELDINGYLTELQRLGFIRRYSVAEIHYIQVVHFTKHQAPHNTEKASEIPEESKEKQSGESVTVTERLGNVGQPQAKRSDSLIPDSGFLTPEKNIVGLAPDSTKFNGVEAKAVIDYLNQKAGRQFRHAKANISFIVARLKDGATIEQCKQVIDRQVVKWKGDPKMATYLRPETLFNPTKFESYLGELDAPIPGEKPWTESWSGIVAKGKSLGIEPLDSEPGPEFKRRVMEAAGIAA